MTREELAGKSKQELTGIAKSLGIKGLSRLTRADLVEHILLLDPPYSANPEKAKEISQHLHHALGKTEATFTPPPLPKHLTGVAVMEPWEGTHLPDYNDTLITLMVRDPYWLYTYWNTSDITRQKISATLRDWDHIPLILRVYDVTNIDNFNGTNGNYNFDINITGGANNWYIHVGGPNRSFCVDLGFFLENGIFYTIARSNIVTTPRDNISEVVDEEWMIIEEDFHKLYRLAGGGWGNTSAELVESLIKRLEQEISSGAVSSLSSPGKGPGKQRQFWLVLNTELIVYGATEPDAKVTIQGEPIQLRPDGTFSLRFALPDGVQNIPVVAQSADNIDTICTTPIITKETK